MLKVFYIPYIKSVLFENLQIHMINFTSRMLFHILFVHTYVKLKFYDIFLVTFKILSLSFQNLGL